MHKGRQMYRTRVMLQPFAGNYSHDRRFEKTQFMCRCLQARAGVPPAIRNMSSLFRHPEKFADPLSDENLVEFFNMVLVRRDEIDDKEG